MDIRMPELDGLAATREICAAHDRVRVLVLTTFELDEYVFQAMRAGASGFLGKNMGPAALLAGIRVVARGDALLSAKATAGLIARFRSQPSTVRRRGAAPAGRADRAGARDRRLRGSVQPGHRDRLVLSPATVKTHLNRAMAKLGARDRAQLVVIAYQSSLAAVAGIPRGQPIPVTGPVREPCRHGSPATHDSGPDAPGHRLRLAERYAAVLLLAVDGRRSAALRVDDLLLADLSFMTVYTGTMLAGLGSWGFTRHGWVLAKLVIGRSVRAGRSGGAATGLLAEPGTEPQLVGMGAIGALIIGV